MSTSFVEGKPEAFLATVAERIPHSGYVIDTFRRFSDQRTWKAQVRIVRPAAIGDIDFVLTGEPRDRRVNNLLMYLLPNLLGPVTEMDVQVETKVYPQPRLLELKTGYDYMGSPNPDRSVGGWKKDFITGLTIPNINPLSEEGKWVLRVSRYFMRGSERYCKDNNPQARIQTLKELDEEFDWSPRRFLAALEERGFADLSVMTATASI